MECPHLDKTSPSHPTPLTILESIEELKCSECVSKESVWLCITCGVLSCGRYVKAHGLKHKEYHKTHSLCIETKELSVFCYDCDEFVINDTPDKYIQQLRNKLIQRIILPEKPDNSTVKSRALRPRVKRAVNSPVMGGSSPKRAKPVLKSEAQNKSKKGRGPKKRLGLRNLGNTCFMNSVLQSLSNIERFCNILTSLPSLEHQLNTNRDSKLALTKLSSDGIIVTEELKQVLRILRDGEDKSNSISPESLFHAIWKTVPRFRGYQQQDAHEFLRYMLDRLHTELLLLLPGKFRNDRVEEVLRGSPLAKSNSVVTSVFGGTLQSEVTCLNCRSTSKKLDPFLDLSVDIPQQFTGPVRKCKDRESGNQTCHIHDCLQKFMETEELADSERFFCNTCKSKQPSTKKFMIRRLPNVLCLHVKRFRWTAYARTKLDNHIEFPVTGMDMSGYLLRNQSGTRLSSAGSSLYDLAAVIVHHGTGTGSGHYTAFATNNQAWFHFNDCTVKESDYQTVCSTKAYILFYIQRELDFS